MSGATWALVDGSSPTGDDEGVWLCSGLVQRIEARHPDEVAHACARLEQAARARYVVALLDYELGYWLEPRAALRPPEITRAPLTALVFEQEQ